MANTYTQLYVQIVFAVKYRQNLIHEENREKVEKYICGIIKKNKSKPIAIYCNPDHIHIFLSIHPGISISELVRDIKANSSKWINKNNWLKKDFRWQGGFGAFTYSKSHIDNVIRYIKNQPNHHKTNTFKNEYIGFLTKFNIEYNDQYLFDFHD